MSMSAGVAGVRRSWEIELAHASTDVNIATSLSAASAPTTRHIRVDVPNANTVGGVAAAAISAGTLSAYPKVRCLLYGKVHGFGGAASSGDGGDAIDGNNQSNLTVDLMSGGELRGGGGGGGNGGKGGSGEQANWAVPFTYSRPSTIEHGWGTDPNISTWWGAVKYNETSYDTRIYWKASGPSGANIWAKGSWRLGQWYEIRYGTYSSSSGGNGGAGGQGQGYNQTLAAGNSGNSASNRAGTGGTGGTGGDWGSTGQSRTTTRGGTGYTISNSSYNVSQNGSYGSSGGAAGKALTNATGVTFNNNGGTVSGALS